MPHITDQLSVYPAPIRSRGVSAFLPLSVASILTHFCRIRPPSTPAPISTLHRHSLLKCCAPRQRPNAPPHHPQDMIAFPVFAEKWTSPLPSASAAFTMFPASAYPRLNYENLHRPFSLSRHGQPRSLRPRHCSRDQSRIRRFPRRGELPSRPPREFPRSLAQRHNSRQGWTIIRWSTSASKTPAPTQNGRVNGCRPRKNGSLPRKAANGRRYPWGDQWQPSACNHGQFGGTTPVQHFPEGGYARRNLRFVRQRLGVDGKRTQRWADALCDPQRRVVLPGAWLGMVRRRRSAAERLRREIPAHVSRSGSLRDHWLSLRS